MKSKKPKRDRAYIQAFGSSWMCWHCYNQNIRAGILSGDEAAEGGPIPKQDGKCPYCKKKVVTIYLIPHLRKAKPCLCE